MAYYLTYYLQLTEEFMKNFKSGSGKIMVETPLYLLHMPDKVLEKFKEHVASLKGDVSVEDSDYDVKSTSVCCLART